MKLKEMHEATQPARLQARGAAHGGTLGVGGVGVRAALLDALDAEAICTALLANATDISQIEQPATTGYPG